MVCGSVIAILLVLVIIAKIYLKLTTGWCKNYTCLVGKTIIVTGANTGIGYETALDLAKRGGRIILACRNVDKAEEARRKIIDETGNENIVVKIIDMSSLDSVRKFAKDINENEERLDILINNAGAGGLSNRITEDGYQLLMEINYLSSFLLTILLLKLLKKSAPSRIINVSSIAARQAKLNVKNLNEFPGPSKLYYNTKLCNILFTKELAKKIEGSSVTTYSLHPGVVETDIFRKIQGYRRIILYILKFFFKDRREGAQTSIYLATEKGIEKYNGEHFHDCHKIDAYSTAKVPGLSKKLWESTADLMQLKPEDLQI